jgi:TP901 family phage tail tape measure protein
MSDVIAEAKVAIVPDFTQFGKQLQTGLQQQIQQATKGASATLASSLTGQAAATTRVANATAGANAVQQKFNKTVDQSGAKLLGLGSDAAKLDAALLGLRTAVGSTAVIGLGAGALAAIALGKALRALVGETARFETNLNTFQVVAGATADEMERVTRAAEQLGADITLPAVSASDAAEAMTELSKAGLSVQDSIDGARGVLQLAAAAAIDNATAVELAASALNAFGLSGREAVTVADTLANAANAAQGSIVDIGTAMAQAAAVGRQVGLSFQDTATFLTILAKNGLRGSDAGTSLRTALIRLINPSKEAAEAVADLGIEIRNTDGSLRVDVFQQLANALRGATPAVRDQTLALIGGQDALRALSILGRQSARDLLVLRAELREQGTAAEVAGARTKGLAGAAESLSSSLQTVGVRLGTSVAPGAAAFVRSITDAVNAMANSEGVAAAFATSADAVGAALGAIGSAAGAAAPLVLTLASAFGSLTAAVGGAQILATAAAFVVVRKALVGLSAGTAVNVFTTLGVRLLYVREAAGRTVATLRLMAATMATAFALGGPLASLSVLRAALAATTASMLKFAASPVGIAVAVAGAVTAIGFLISRTTDLERAQKAAKTATDNLVTSLGNLRSAREAVGLGQRDVRQNLLAVEQARLAEAQARAALAGTNAPRGSLERQQAVVALATAIQNLQFAEEDLAKSQALLNERQRSAAGLSAAAKEQLREQAAAVNDLVRQQIKQATVFLTSERGRQGPLREKALELERAAVLRLAESYRLAAREAFKSGEVDRQAIGRRQALLAALLKQARDATKIDFKIVFNPEASLRQVGQKLSASFRNFGFSSAEEFLKWFSKTTASGAGGVVAGLGPELEALLKEELADVGKGAGNIVATNIRVGISNKLRGQVKGLQERELDLQIAGASDSALLANLRRQEAKQRAVIARDIKKGFAEETIRRDKEELNSIVQRRRALEESLAAESRRAADEIQEKRDERNQNILRMFQSARDRAQLKITIAEGTRSLRDDIEFTIALRNIVRQQIKNAEKLIKDRKVLRDFLASSNAVLASLNNQIRALRDQRDENLRQRREAAAQQRKDALRALVESAQLDVSFADIGDNVNKEIAARRALIRALRKAQAEETRGSQAWKDYRNRIAQTTAEIKELQKEKKKENRAAQELAFEFLTAQQGFAANLLGNLIPGGATGGLVGGGSSAPTAGVTVPKVGPLSDDPALGSFAAAQRDISDRGAVADGRAQPTAGQMATLIQLTGVMVEVLKDLKRGVGHPEAKRSAVTQKTSMDMIHY